jgi:hypothetical protein
MPSGSLVVIGTGIRTVGHLTMEAIAWMKAADKVFYVVGDPVAESTLKELCPTGAESLSTLYGEGKPRLQTYLEMVDRVLASVREGQVTVLACYGHPGVFVFPSHEAIRRARTEGFQARMLPGISAEDCLFADLGVDPGIYGCQSFEATDFLINGRVIDPRSSVVLWQIGVLGDSTFKPYFYDLSAFSLLVERLLQIYPPAHQVYLYEAAVFPNCEPVILPTSVQALSPVGLSAGYTLYIPPAYPTTSDPVTYARMLALQQSAAVYRASEPPPVAPLPVPTTESPARTDEKATALA